MRFRRLRACLAAAIWLALAAGRASAAAVARPVETPAAPLALPAVPASLAAATAVTVMATALKLAPTPVATALLPTPPALIASAIPGGKAPLATAAGSGAGANATVRIAERAETSAAGLQDLFDGSGRPGFTPHQQVPKAILPDGSAIAPDSFHGGYHGNTISPEKVVADGGFRARGPNEDWNLADHAESLSKSVSAFRGSTPFPTSPDGDTGASYWADAGGWVYDIAGVPTWGVNSNLEGRINRGAGYRGALMEEIESALPARTPLECIKRWGQVRENTMGKLFVPLSSWVVNPSYDAVACHKFWGH